MNRYSNVVRWSDEDEAYIAVCPELGGISAFGDTPAEALAELEVAAELAIETYRDEGWPLPAPSVVQEYSGQFRCRLPRSLHAQLAQRAEADGVSQNTLVVAYIAAGLGHAQAAAKFEGALQRMQESVSALGGVVSALHSEATNAVEYQDPTLRRVYGDEGPAVNTFTLEANA